jgi:cytidylate kinase
MPVITISRGSYKLGRKVAEQLAGRLGYSCIAREDLLQESDQFNSFDVKLRRALHATTASVFDQYSNEKNEYLAYMRQAILRHLVKDNVVYHGLAGHAFALHVPHLLNVRIQADVEVRMQEEMEQANVSAAQARDALKKAEEERRLWSLYVTGIDHWDPTYYDAIFNASKISAEHIVDLLSQMAAYPSLQATEASQRTMDNLYLASRVKNLLVRDHPQARVHAEQGRVTVTLSAPKHLESKLIESVKAKTQSIEEIEHLDVSLTS